MSIDIPHVGHAVPIGGNPQVVVHQEGDRFVPIQGVRNESEHRLRNICAVATTTVFGSLAYGAKMLFSSETKDNDVNAYYFDKRKASDMLTLTTAAVALTGLWSYARRDNTCCYCIKATISTTVLLTGYVVSILFLNSLPVHY